MDRAPPESADSIFVTVDHASTEWLGIHAARRATRFEALEPLRPRAPSGAHRFLKPSSAICGRWRVRVCFGAFREDIAHGLKLRHDPICGAVGSPHPTGGSQTELAFLGIESSPAFGREPERKGCVERFIRTLKENLLWVRRFATIVDLGLALHAFMDIDNQTWIVERHGDQTPAAVRAAQLAPLPAAA